MQCLHSDNLLYGSLRSPLKDTHFSLTRFYIIPQNYAQLDARNTSRLCFL